MPSFVIAAAISAAVSGSVAAGAFAFSWAAFASSLVLGGLSRALQKKPGEQQASLSSQGRLVNLRQPISSWQVIAGQARVGGTITFVEVVSRSGGTNNVINLVITFSGHVCQEIGDIYFGDEVVPIDADGAATGRYAGYVLIKKSLGDESGQPFPDLVLSWSDGKWTDAHRQTGRTKIWVALIASPDLWPTGLPVITAVVKGAKVYDTRTETTAWSANAALWTAHYLSDADAYTIGADYSAEIDTDDLDAAANVCDEAVTLAAGGDEARYEVNGAFLVSEKPEDVLARLLAAMAGKAVNHGGAWHIYPGAYYAPTITLDESDLAGPIRVQSLVSRRENCNGVKGIFTDPESSWQPTDFPAIASATYMAEDNGERVWRDVDYSAFVTSGTQAQRLAKIELLRTRQPVTAAAPHKLTAYGIVPGRTVALDNTKFGWSAKAFDVERASLVFGEDGRLTIDLAGRETAEAVYDWDTSEEQAVDPAPNTTLPDPFTVGTPGTLAIEEVLYDTSGSAGVMSRAIVTWASVDPFATKFSVEYKLVADSYYTVAPTVEATTLWLDDLAPGTYYFRHRAISSVTGVRSAYSPVVTKEIRGLTAPPADMTGFSLTPLGAQAALSWDLTSDLDVKIGGRAMFRWSPQTDGATWNDGFEVANVPGGFTEVTVVHMTGTYMGRFQDSSGNQSENMIEVVTTAPDVIAFNAIETLTQDPDFAGTKSGCVAVDGILKLDGVTLVDDLPDLVDDWGYVDGMGGITSSGTYDFDDAVDLSAVYTCRVTATLETLSIDSLNAVDDRLDEIDSWGSIDGPEISDVNAQLFVATTDDDPGGSPTWSSWRPFIIGDYKARGFKFRLGLQSRSLDHNIEVHSLAVSVDMPDREDGARNVASGTGTYSVVYTLSPGFKALPKIGITAKDMGTGDYFTISGESTTGFDIAFRNSAAGGVSRTFDWRVKGY